MTRQSVPVTASVAQQVVHTLRACRYVQLCAEDHLWWWRSFHRGGAPAVYLLAYTLLFLYNGLPAMHGLSVLLYLAYMAVVALGVHLSLGAIGFLASTLFVHATFAGEQAVRAGNDAQPSADEHTGLLQKRAQAGVDEQDVVAEKGNSCTPPSAAAVPAKAPG